LSGTIYLIVEDQNDAKIVQTLINARGLSVRVRSLTPTGNMGGITRLVKDLDKLIQQAKSQKAANDCIAVLHDWDIHKQPDRTHYDRITETCSRYDDVVQVIARDEIEAWLLADAGVCNWLGLKPQNRDNARKPKVELNHLLKKAGKKSFEGRGIAEVLKHVNGTGVDHSPSMENALTHLENAPCVK